MRLLDEGPKVSLARFAAMLTEDGVDPEPVTRMARALLAYYGGNGALRGALREDPTSSFLRIEERWYASLATGKPDYGVYDDPMYVADVWACWALYSRGYLRAIERAGLLVDMGGEPVLDLGCGCGFTTAALAELLPGSQVCGTQLRTSPQWGIASRMGERHRFQVTDVLPARAGVVFASEFFEHFLEPVKYLREVLACGPRLIFTANAFGPRSTGHFDEYVVNGVAVSPRAASKAFDAELVERGYAKVPTSFWNGRPTCWRLSNAPRPRLFTTGGKI